MLYCLLLVSSLLVVSSQPILRANSKDCLWLVQCVSITIFSDDDSVTINSITNNNVADDGITENNVTNNDVVDNDVTIDNGVTNSDEVIDTVVEENATDDGEIIAVAQNDNITDQSSHDLEARSHDDNDYTVNTNIKNCHKQKQKLSVNGLSYRRLLEKEEMEDNCEESVITMEDLTVETSDVAVKQNGSNVLRKLKSVKNQATSTFLIFISLLK